MIYIATVWITRPDGSVRRYVERLSAADEAQFRRLAVESLRVEPGSAVEFGPIGFAWIETRKWRTSK